MAVGLDIGTSSVKACAVSGWFAPKLRALGKRRLPHNFVFPSMIGWPAVLILLITAGKQLWARIKRR